MIKLVLLDPHPVVQKGFKTFFKKTENITVKGTFTTIKELVDFLSRDTADVVVFINGTSRWKCGRHHSESEIDAFQNRNLDLYLAATAHLRCLPPKSWGIRILI